jgi:malate permease and related proteins
MEFYFTLFTKLLALSSLAFLGFIARKFLNIERESIAKLIFYILVPITFFHAIGQLKPEPELIILPFLTAGISGLIAFLIFYIGRNRFDNSTIAIFSFSSVNSNVGYFLLPLVWALFDDKAAGIFVIMVLGNVIYENTIGFFIAYQGHYSAKESMIKILKLPALYGVLLGFLFSYSPHLHIPEMLDETLMSIRGSYATLGMMMVGIGLADIEDLNLDLKFIGGTFIVKFILWPLIALICIALDKYLVHAFDPIAYKMLILFSVAPLAANNIIIATILNLHPNKVSASVVASTIFSVFYIPIVISFID